MIDTLHSAIEGYILNYLLVYDSLMNNYKGNSYTAAKKLYGYVETHHIIPRCMGGTDDKENLIHLPARVHFLAHYLLVKIYPTCRGLWYALKFMSCYDGSMRNPMNSLNSSKFRISSRVYELVKRKISELGFSEEHKANMRKAMKGKKHVLSEDGLAAIRKAAKERIVDLRTEESKLKSSIAIREALAKKKELGLDPTEKRLQGWESIKGPRGPQSEETRQKKRDAWAKRKEAGLRIGPEPGKKRGPYKKKINQIS